MNNNMTKAHLRLLRENYEKACNGYLLALSNMWEWDCKSYGFWIGDEVGGIYAYGDTTFINMDDIIYCVENNVSKDTYDEWSEYCVWASHYELSHPNLKSWVMGCPRISETQRDKIDSARNELDRLIDEMKSKQQSPF